METIALVVPVYNEASRFPRTAPLLAEFVSRFPAGSELVFVDDGSSDETAVLAEAFASEHAFVRVVRRPHAGKGAAVRAGLESAQADYAGFCDVDLATPLHELEEILRAAGRGEMLAIGSRDLAASVIERHESTLRELLGKAYNRFVQLTLTPGVLDTQCGAKVASTKIWRQLLPYCREDGFAFDVELVAVARALGVPVQEVAITWRHDPASRINVVRDGAAMLAAIPRVRKRVAAIPRRGGFGGGAADPQRKAFPGRQRRTPRPDGIFDAPNAEALMEADAAHWWFRSKASYVAWALKRFTPHEGWLADLGAGAGGVTALLGWKVEQTVCVEGAEVLVRRARDRHALMAVAGSLHEVPLDDASASVACLLDVIEHMDDPLPALREARRVLAPGGRLVVNVPAHPRLWSPADEFLGHARRYTMRLLREHLRACGFRPVFMSHVFSWLVPPVWITRRVATDTKRQLGLAQTSPVLDKLALFLTGAERLLLRRFRLPLGTSILCVAEVIPGPA